MNEDEAEPRPILDGGPPANTTFDQATVAADNQEATEIGLHEEDDSQDERTVEQQHQHQQQDEKIIEDSDDCMHEIQWKVERIERGEKGEISP